MRYGAIRRGDAVRAPILPFHHVPSRNLDPGRLIRLSQNYGGGNPRVSRTGGRLGFNMSLQCGFGTIDGIKSGVSHIFGLRSDNRNAKLSSYTIDPAAAYEKPNQKSTPQASASIFIDVVKESSDVYTPLKFVAGGLWFVLKYYDVGMPVSPNRLHRSLLNQQTVVNRETIKSLIPRVEGFAKSLSTPAPTGEFKEIKRREELKG